MTAAQLPANIAQRCVTVTSELGLVVSGIDLRRTPEGRWFCFEVNTCPAFSWFEDHIGQPIAAAIARYLASA
jgi:D-alanine-D-alanine ligase-like ATP-grasp enzyme